MSAAETIAAISTPPGRGGIGIVRLSGPEAVSIAEQLVRLSGPMQHARARLADVLDAEESESRIDEALVTLFAAPNSYTGADLVEVAAHGSPVVLDLLLRRALELGARLAEPGEFTQRAFLSGRIDLTQAEAVRDLIEAQTLSQARLAASQMGGALSARVMPTKIALLELIALLEAGIDFAEDDLAVAPNSEILRRIAEIRPPLEALEGTFGHGRILHDGLTMALVGRPNAGKSSVFNALLERDRAIVTAIPGTTRDTVTERIALGGIPLELVDTAGLREGVDEAERLGIARSREALADAAIVLIVMDGAAISASGTIPEEDQRLLKAVEGRAALVAWNKSDLSDLSNLSNLSNLPTSILGPVSETKPGPSHDSRHDSSHDSRHDESDIAHRATGIAQCEEAIAQSPAGIALYPTAIAQRLPIIATSAVTGAGIAELREAILKLATGGAAAEPGMLTSLRHHQSITAALQGLTDAQLATQSEIPHEMIMLDLYRTLWALDSLTGQTTPDDVLNLIFSSFCIGK